jgi:hypothetical protein
LYRNDSLQTGSSLLNPSPSDEQLGEVAGCELLDLLPGMYDAFLQVEPDDERFEGGEDGS